MTNQLKYIVLLLLIGSRLVAQDANKGTIRVEKTTLYTNIKICPAYIDSNKIEQVYIYENSSLISVDEIRKATFLRAYAEMDTEQIPVKVLSFVITVAKREEDLKDFPVKGNLFYPRILFEISALQPGDVLYFDEIIVKNKPAKARGLVVKIVE